MQKILLFLSLLLFHGCSLNELFLKDELDKVSVVKYTNYLKHHRAYFSRDNLEYMKDKKKYIYLYNTKTNDVGILLKRKNQYHMYNMSNPKIATIITSKDENTTFSNALKFYALQGFKPTSSLSDNGHEVKASYKIYKEVKTILIEAKDYTKLQSLYRKAIFHYDSSKIKSIKTILPKRLIQNYSKHYSKRTASRTQLLQLKTIAEKLNLQPPTIPEIEKKNTKKEYKKRKKPITKPLSNQKEIKVVSKKDITQQKPVEKEPAKRVPKKNLVSNPKVAPYKYYLNHASLRELRKYITNSTTKYSLSRIQYNKLIQRKKELQEERLLKDGSLEDIIAAYKTNKNPKYKKRIMMLMKKKQLED